MFVSKKRYEEEVKRLKDRLKLTENSFIDSETDLMDAEREIDNLETEVKVLKVALRNIAAQRTPGANATVNRMAKIAEEALEPTKAEFVTDAPQPEGTLASLRKVILGGIQDGVAKGGMTKFNDITVTYNGRERL